VIVAVPAETPVTSPEVNPTVAIEVLLLVQLPPGIKLVRVIMEPAQTLPAPEIEEGVGLTSIVSVV
jgi:hypothetical protein